MSAPLRSRRDPQALGRGWEVAFVVAAVVLGAVAGAALVGIGIAAAWWGGGWVWPPSGREVGAAVVGLVQGRLGEGYPAADAARLADPLPTYVLVGVSEVALLAAVVCAFVVGRDRMRAASSGMATRRQAEQALGVSRLRSVRAVVRPDLDRH